MKASDRSDDLLKTQEETEIENMELDTNEVTGTALSPFGLQITKADVKQAIESYKKKRSSFWGRVKVAFSDDKDLFFSLERRLLEEIESKSDYDLLGAESLIILTGMLTASVYVPSLDEKFKENATAKIILESARKAYLLIIDHTFSKNVSKSYDSSDIEKLLENTYAFKKPHTHRIILKIIRRLFYLAPFVVTISNMSDDDKLVVAYHLARMNSILNLFTGLDVVKLLYKWVGGEICRKVQRYVSSIKHEECIEKILPDLRRVMKLDKERIQTIFKDFYRDNPNCSDLRRKTVRILYWHSAYEKKLFFAIFRLNTLLSMARRDQAFTTRAGSICTKLLDVLDREDLDSSVVKFLVNLSYDFSRLLGNKWTQHGSLYEYYLEKVLGIALDPKRTELFVAICNLFQVIHADLHVAMKENVNVKMYLLATIVAGFSCDEEKCQTAIVLKTILSDIDEKEIDVSIFHALVKFVSESGYLNEQVIQKIKDFYPVIYDFVSVVGEYEEQSFQRSLQLFRSIDRADFENLKIVIKSLNQGNIDLTDNQFYFMMQNSEFLSYLKKNIDLHSNSEEGYSRDMHEDLSIVIDQKLFSQLRTEFFYYKKARFLISALKLNESKFTFFNRLPNELEEIVCKYYGKETALQLEQKKSTPPIASGPRT